MPEHVNQVELQWGLQNSYMLPVDFEERIRTCWQEAWQSREAGLAKPRLAGSSVLFLSGKSFCLCVLLITLTPYQSTKWQTALNDFLALDSHTLAQPFFALNENLCSPPNFHFRTRVRFHPHSSHSHPAIRVKAATLSSHLARIRQPKPAHPNGRTDSRRRVSSRRGWYHPPRARRTSSPGRTHSHTAQLGLLFPLSRKPSLEIFKTCLDKVLYSLL